MWRPTGNQDRFSIFDWAPNPMTAILWRELLTTLRQRRYGAILIAAAALTLFVILRNFFGMVNWMISPAMMVTNVLGMQYGALLAFVFLVVPALSAVALAAERQQETEDLLYMALFRPIALMLGKLIAVLAVFALFHIALLPLATFIYFFAGIEVLSFFQIQFTLYTTALAHAAIGVMVSRVLASPNRAVLLAYVFIAAIYLLPHAAWLHAASSAPGAAGLPAAPFNPMTLISALLGNTAGWPECGGLLARQGLGTAVIVLVCIAVDALRPAASVVREHLRRIERRPRPTYGPLPDWGNPIYHKDRRAAPLAQVRWGLVAFLLFAGLAYAFNGWSARHLDFSVTALEAGALTLYVLIPILVLESCNREMAPNSLILLRLSRLGSDRVLLGKALAIVHMVAPAVLGVLAGTATAVALHGLPELNAGPGPGQSMYQLIYKGAMLGPKAVVATAICFLFTRFRAPGPADLAMNLALSGIFVAVGEAVSHGLFESMLSAELGPVRTAVVAIGHLFAMAFSTVILFSVALMRFETVFDEGSDIYAISHVDRRNF